MMIVEQTPSPEEVTKMKRREFKNNLTHHNRRTRTKKRRKKKENLKNANTSADFE